MILPKMIQKCRLSSFVRTNITDVAQKANFKQLLFEPASFQYIPFKIFVSSLAQHEAEWIQLFVHLCSITGTKPRTGLRKRVKILLGVFALFCRSVCGFVPIILHRSAFLTAWNREIFSDSSFFTRSVIEKARNKHASCALVSLYHSSGWSCNVFSMFPSIWMAFSVWLRYCLYQRFFKLHSRRIIRKCWSDHKLWEFWRATLSSTIKFASTTLKRIAYGFISIVFERFASWLEKKLFRNWELWSWAFRGLWELRVYWWAGCRSWGSAAWTAWEFVDMRPWGCTSPSQKRFVWHLRRSCLVPSEAFLASLGTVLGYLVMIISILWSLHIVVLTCCESCITTLYSYAEIRLILRFIDKVLIKMSTKRCNNFTGCLKAEMSSQKKMDKYQYVLRTKPFYSHK